ncbi:hypothetical protein LTR85_000692 [Meristemomyces frigidus]|nr:hypothetical protein LTR85_000692 [Meristemomyces frigidus]
MGQSLSKEDDTASGSDNSRKKPGTVPSTDTLSTRDRGKPPNAHQKPIHILVKKRICGRDQVPQFVAGLVNKSVSVAFRHWALRVGDDVFELRKNRNLENSRRRLSWSEVADQYDCTELQGYTTCSLDHISELAQMKIASMPYYNSFTKNCQSFVLRLMEDIPRSDISGPLEAHKHNLLRKLLGDLADYVLARKETKHTSLQSWLDEAIWSLKTTVVMVLLAVVGYFRRGLIVGTTFMWRLLTQLPIEAVKSLAQFLSSPLGVATMAAAAAAVAAGLLLWLAWRGGNNFWEWWKKHGSSIDTAILARDGVRGAVQLALLEDGRNIEMAPADPDLVDNATLACRPPHRLVRRVQFQ